MNLVREYINEKFTEDSDPIKDMGIGAKIVYYDFFQFHWLHNTELYYLIISGETFNIKNILKEERFKWADIIYAWKSVAAHPQEIWEKTAPKIFEKIEKVPGYVVRHKNINPNSFTVPGYEESNYPEIPDGIGLKIYVVKAIEQTIEHIYLTGKGTYHVRKVLHFFGFKFNETSHKWEQSFSKTESNDYKIQQLLNYLKEHNYEIILKHDVKESLSEKFTEDSDPIKDLGIGIFTLRTFPTRKDAHDFITDVLPAILGLNNFPDDILNDSTHYGDRRYYIHPKYINKLKYYFSKYIELEDEDDAIFYPEHYHRYLKKRFPKLKSWMIESVNEKFIDISDPIKDMNIGLSDEELLLELAINLFGDRSMCDSYAEKGYQYFEVYHYLPMRKGDWRKLREAYGKQIPLRYLSQSNIHKPNGSEYYLNFVYLLSEIYNPESSLNEWYWEDTILIQIDREIADFFDEKDLTFKKMMDIIRNSPKLTDNRKK